MTQETIITYCPIQRPLMMPEIMSTNEARVWEKLQRRESYELPNGELKVPTMEELKRQYKVLPLDEARRLCGKA